MRELHWIHKLSVDLTLVLCRMNDLAFRSEKRQEKAFKALPRLFPEKTRGYCYSLGVVVVVQKLTFCHISAITEHIYLNLKNICSLAKGECMYRQGR